MRRRSIVLLLVCVFVAGVFFGIWADWRIWKNKAARRKLVYEVQAYPMANLQVHPGDTVSLVPPGGGSSAGLNFNFTGYIPCKGQISSNPCVIADDSTPGPYFFNCSGNGYSCLDPGIQQSPTIPGHIDFGETAEIDLASLLGVNLAPATPTPTPVPGSPSAPASNAITASVSCNSSNMTTLNDPISGNSLTTIPAKVGQTVFWVSPKPFTLDTSNFPPGLCSPANPPSGTYTYPNQPQCTIALGGKTVPYTVQAQTTPTACAPTTDAKLQIN